MDESVDVEDIEKIVDIECEEAEQRVKQEQEVAGNKEESESGKLSNLISSFFHHDEEGAAAQAPEKEIPASAEKPEKETDDGNSSSSLVDSLIAKLPSPLSDEAAPETEEASILIHSIVHD